MPSAGTQGVELFATRSDLLGVFLSVEGKRPLKYVSPDMRETEEREVFYSVSVIPALGIAKYGINVREARFLVLPRDLRIVVTPVEQYSGETLHKVDPRDHPGSVTLHCSGVYNDETLISGTIETARTDQVAVETMKDLRREIKKQFTRVREYWFGPEALLLYHQGMRATQDIRSVPELDFPCHVIGNGPSVT